jgi:hypothetical protein
VVLLTFILLSEQQQPKSQSNNSSWSGGFASLQGIVRARHVRVGALTCGGDSTPVWFVVCDFVFEDNPPFFNHHAEEC